MGISGISNTINNYVDNDDSLSLKKAIKAYQDERLTGLTDEEREEIDRRSKEYLVNHPVRSEQDRAVFNSYVKNLVKIFGFKGDIDEFAASAANGIYNKLENSNEQPAQTNITEHFERSAIEAMMAKNRFYL